MVIDQLKNSVKHLYERVSSPFGGTFISVWTIHNWKLIYSFFTFDEKQRLWERIGTLEFYIERINWWDGFTFPLLITFAVIIIYNILTNAGLIISVWFNKWSKPFIYELVDKNKLATKEDYDNLKTQLHTAYEVIAKEKEIATDARRAKEDIEKKLAELATSYFSANDEASKLKKELLDLQRALDNGTFNSSEIENLKNVITEQTNVIQELQNSVLKPEESLEKIFSGKWRNDFIVIDGRTGSEKFEIKDKINYVINNQVQFKIEDIYYSDNLKYLQFNKVRISNGEITLNCLVKVTDHLYIGTEPGGTIVKYSKISVV